MYRLLQRSCLTVKERFGQGLGLEGYESFCRICFLVCLDFLVCLEGRVHVACCGS